MKQPDSPHKSYDDCVQNALYWIKEVYLENITEEELKNKLHSLQQLIEKYCLNVPPQCTNAGIIIALQNAEELLPMINEYNDMISQKSFKRRVINSLQKAKHFT